MAEPNIFYDFEIFYTTQNPLYLLAEAAFISEKTRDSNKLTQNGHYSNPTTYSDHSQEIFTETSHHSTSNNDDKRPNFSEKRKVITSNHTNIKTTSKINDVHLNSVDHLDSRSSTKSDLTSHSDSFSTDVQHCSDSGNLKCNNHKVRDLMVKLNQNKRPVSEIKHKVNENQDVIKSSDKSFSKDNSNVSEKKISERKVSYDDNKNKRRMRQNKKNKFQPYVTKSNRISRPPSGSAGGRWTGS